MSFESLTNRGEYLSAHYLAEILPATLKGGLLKQWSEDEKSGRVTPRTGLRGLRRTYFDAKTELADDEFFDPERLHKLHQDLLRALGFEPQPQTITVERAGQEQQIKVAHAELTTAHGIVALDCGWAVDTEAAQDPDDAGRLLDPVALTANDTIDTGAKLASWLFAAETPPRYVLILSGGVITLADRSAWGEGRYLAVSLDTTYGRNDDKEYDVVAALFGADSLRPPAEGGTEPLADLVAGSRQHAVGVSSELREGLKVSVELIANEVLDRIRQAGYQPHQVMDLDELAKELGREALRYLYRILFLLYAEARPELGVLPVNDREYLEGYSLARIGDLVSRRLAPSAEGGFHLHESLDLLFRMVNDGHRPRGGAEVADKASEGEGLRFEPMRSDLFLPEKTKLIGRLIAEPGSDPDDPDGPKIDTRLRNKVLYQVLRRLMLTKGAKKRRGGFISYAQLGINQLGAVYEGLMSYTGFVATEQLYEVAKNGDPKDGSWMIPASKADDYEDGVFVYKEDPYTGVRSRVSYAPGAFVYRLAGRDRQTSASYYTPQSLTEVTVQLALEYRVDQDGTETKARELLDWTICEPALGSGAFLNEAINQVAAEYLRRRQKELDVSLDPEHYHLELQRVKAYIALHNCYGVDLNRTAVELAEVSLWLNVMHTGLQAPWFGLHLQRGNSLIGCGRKLYDPKQLADKSWLTTPPTEKPFRVGPIDDEGIHHFLLPADGWGAVAGEKEARELAPAETEKLKKWRTAMKRVPSAKGKLSQVKRLQALARRVEYLWHLVQRRLEISEREIRRDIRVWGADDLPTVTEAVPREKILADLTRPSTPYWRLKTLMDVWCALWFWPLDKAGLLDGSDPAYPAGPVEVTYVKDLSVYDEPASFEVRDLFGQVQAQQLKMPVKPTGTRKMTVAEQLRQQVPLADLDDWLTFAEALIGRSDIPPDSLVSGVESLSELGVYEGDLPGLMGMDEAYRLADRFPWLQAAETIADQQRFFHWELTFAQAFARGGFDLQVGNPPWVRPDWKEDEVLAELDPWFRLVERVSVPVWRSRKSEVLRDERARSRFLNEIVLNTGTVEALSHATTYPIMVGTRPNLYRTMMCQVWAHLGNRGTAGLVHPDSHFGGTNEGRLRNVAYRHLRVHGGFVNGANWAFSDANRNIEFGVHIYGTPGPIKFSHLSRLYEARPFIESLKHAGDGPVPSQRYQGTWDNRPHRARVIHVDEATLSIWNRLRGGGAGDDVTHAPLLQPITVAEERAITALSLVSQRLGLYVPWISRGYDEANGKKEGLIQWAPGTPEELGSLVMQGPHFGIATPFAKQPRVRYHNNHDWDTLDQSTLPESFVPRANYSLGEAEAKSFKGQDVWNGKRYTSYYRLAWRRMIAFNMERSLFAAIMPPGPAYVDAVHSLAFADSRQTALTAGFWASLPLDYLLRIAGKSNLRTSEVLAMPSGDSSHPLASELLVRCLRLNCLTAAFAELWEELFDSSWQLDAWAAEWPGLAPLGDIAPTWSSGVPLREERARRAALVEIDALVSVWLGIGIEELLAIFKGRYFTLKEREDQMWFDAAGRKIAADSYTFGYGQTADDWQQLAAYLDDPERNPVPEGYTAPFYKADRENEYRQAHAVFSKRMQSAIDAGWQPS
ncbi:class I SAM-dependent DNA methyltransferase [Micromonospora sp. CA-244673]|uniref:class I SAM-dependent DNA methyltransferase n=1 Tax=Micromonospora sp. CA-244673 TaxID=3239958 RepID=UPI003D8DB994